MASTAGSFRRFFLRPEGLMLAALTAAAITLVSAAAIGGRNADEATDLAGESQDEFDDGDSSGDPLASAAPGTTSGPGVPGAPGAPGGPSTSAGPGGGIVPPDPKQERRSTTGATREGVHGDYFEIGMHAPLTFDGAPLPLAEDPVTGIKGYITHLNRNGGVNGLKVRLNLIDDRYTVSGGRAAGDKLAREAKPFFIEGTLGIDQIYAVLLKAKAAGIPYFAGGGPEPEFKDLGMYQIISNYDQYMNFLTGFICKYGKQYVGGEVRLGTTTLNSNLILPVEKRFVTALENRRCVKSPVDSNARTTIEKPTEQDTYQQQRLKLAGAYGGQGINLLVPLQDPITTTRQLLEWQGASWKWTFSNFAHDSDTMLTLAAGKFAGFRGISGGCYYHPKGGGKPYDANLCSKMGVAHDQWAKLGNVTFDENAGGGVGGKSSYNYNEESWQTDGQGGSTGYQVIYFWHGAMKSMGTDPTREKLLAALDSYSNYSDLLTGPITFHGTPNKMIGAKKFVLLEAKSDRTFRQVTEITPGLVDHF